MDCVGGWGNWGECSDPCGEGKRERIFFVILAPEPGGAACSVEDGAADHERCGTTNDECDVKARLTTAIKDDANVTTAGAVAPQYEEVSLRFTVCITLLQEVQKGQKSKAIAMAAEQQIRHLQAALTDQQSVRDVVSPGLQSTRAMLHRLDAAAPGKQLAALVEDKLVRIASLLLDTDASLSGPLPIYRLKTVGAAFQHIAGKDSLDVTISSLPASWRGPMHNADANGDGQVTKGEFLAAMDASGLCCD